MAFSLQPSFDVCRFFLYIFLVLTSLLSSPSFSAAAAQVTLTWNANSQPDMAGYRVYAKQTGEAYNYSSPVYVGIDTSCTIYNLVDTAEYCFVVRTYGASGSESPDSDEACTTDVSTNESPIADAGPDQNPEAGLLVLLNASNSLDLDDGIASFMWEQVNGHPVELVFDPLLPYAIFVAPEVGLVGDSLIFELTVTDIGGLQSSDKCTVSVNGEGHKDRWCAYWEQFLYFPMWHLFGDER
jgi:hypothetical protein